MSMIPGRFGGAQLLLERVDAEAQVEIEHVRAVFDQQIRSPSARQTTAGRAVR